MKMVLEKIGPERAKELLGKNDMNRTVRRRHVAYLADEMAAGRWKTTTHALGVMADGTLLDGQHRLLAVVASGAEIETWVAYGVEPDVQEVLDNNAPRSVADQLSLIDGLSAAKAKTCVARNLVSIMVGFQTVKLSVAVTRQVVDEFATELDVVLAAVRGFRPAHRGWVVAGLTFALAGAPELEAFVHQVGGGQMLRSSDPAKAVRDWLVNGGPHITNTYRRPAIEALFNAALKARAGKDVTVMRKGPQGLDYFLGSKRTFVGSLKAQLKQQLKR